MSTDPKAQKKDKKAKKPKLSKEERMAQRAAQQATKAAKVAAQAEEASSYKRPVIEHPDDGNFGDLKMNQSKYRTERVWTPIGSVNSSLNGKDVWIRGRVHSVRPQGKGCFLVIRSGFSKVQILLFASKDIPVDMVRYASSIPTESIIDVYGMVAISKERILTATQQDVEIAVKRIYAVTIVEANELPFQIEDASRSEEEIKQSEIESKEDTRKSNYIRVGQDLRLDNRWIDIRTTANHAIFRIQSGVGRYFREYLLSQEFIEIHSPKMISAASEGGADVFKLGYFGKDAFLAQSPQLYKQMALCCDLGKVFEIGPVFRSEKSFTHRHLCEFTGLDLEMEFKEHYHEVLNTIGNMFIYIFICLNKYYKNELDAVRKQYPFEDMLYDQEKMLILTFSEAHGMIKEYYDDLLKQGTKESKKEADDLLFQMEDFSTPMEKKLGQLVRKKFGTEFYCVDKYPLSARPFYTMPDPFDSNVTNSYDIFMRGEEIMSGAQRIHDSNMLIERAKHHGIDISTIQEYVDSFKYAVSPHAGGGVGLERVVMLFMGLDNIRKTSLFPRDPKRVTP